MPHMYIVACFIPLDDAQMPKFKPKPRTSGGNCRLNFSQVTKEMSDIHYSTGHHGSGWWRLLRLCWSHHRSGSQLPTCPPADSCPARQAHYPEALPLALPITLLLPIMPLHSYLFFCLHAHGSISHVSYTCMATGTQWPCKYVT